MTREMIAWGNAERDLATAMTAKIHNLKTVGDTHTVSKFLIA